VPISFTANDDGAALVRLIADPDGVLATPAGQVVVFGPVPDANGTPLTVNAQTVGLAAIAYTLFLTVDDGFNAVASDTLGAPFVVVAGRAGVAPTRSTAYGVLGTSIVMSVGEAENGGTVLNGDAAADDGVLATLNAVTGVFTQHTVSTDVTGIDGPGTARRLRGQGSRFFVRVREADQGMINGDADAIDLMTAYLVPSGPTVTVHPFAGVTPTGQVLGTRALCTLLEAQEGAAGTTQNSDVDTLDTVVVQLESLLNTRITWPRATVANPVVRVKGARGAYLISEAGEGLDMNGDLDAVDTLIVGVDLNSLGPVGNFQGLVGAVPMLNGARDVQPASAFDLSSDARFGYYMNEVAVGASLNGDGDATDQAPSIWDNSVFPPIANVPGAGGGIALDAGPNPRFAFYQGTKFLYTAVEAAAYSPLAGDNGDGEQLDQEILRWTDHAVAPGVTNVLAPALGGAFAALTGLALDGGSVVQVAPTWLAVVVSEVANGGLDLSGEGMMGPALLLIDTATTPPTVYNTGVSPAGSGMIPLTGITDETTGIVVSLPETINGNLNADMDLSDTLLFYFSFATPTVGVNLGAGGPDAFIAGGRIGITANEALTQTDHNGDIDTLDFCFRVVSTTGATELAGRTCAPTSRPAADDGTLWAYLRSEPAELLDLNGDGDQLDFVPAAWKP
jgi:hypothetical protein